jgi:hypothetical protein
MAATAKPAKYTQAASHRSFNVTSTQRPQQRLSSRTVGTFVPKLTKTAFEKFGFSTVALITDWPKIVGAKLAQTTSPDRIRWPKTPGQDTAGRSQGSHRVGATLFLTVDPALALDVQYQAALIIDRINAYFGYRAIADLRIVQERRADVSATVTPVRKPTRPVVPEPTLETIGNPDLRAALERMQVGLSSRAR